MKKLLSLLMCYVFLQAETFAMRGGPSGSGSILQPIGFFSGVFVDISGVGSADVGLFLISVPSAGAANGQVVFYSGSGVDADFYNGIITGLSSPTTAQLVAVFSAQGSTGTSGTRSLNGDMSAKASRTNARGITTLQLTGTAHAQTIEVFTSSSTTLLVAIPVPPVVGPLKTYSVTGWQGTGNAVSGFPSLGAGG